MIGDFRDLIKKSNNFNPPDNLYGDILAHIKKEEKKKRLFLSIFPTIGFSILAISGFYYSFSIFITSEFYFYLKLIFSDGDAILKYWQDSVVLLGESVPVLGVLSLLISVVALIFFIKYITEIIKINNYKLNYGHI